MKINKLIFIIILNTLLVSQIFAWQALQSNNTILISEIIQGNLENTSEESNTLKKENLNKIINNHSDTKLNSGKKEIIKTKLEVSNSNKENDFKENTDKITKTKEEKDSTKILKKEEKETIIKEVLKKEEVKTKKKIEVEKMIVKNETEEDIVKKLLTQKYKNQIDKVLSDIDEKIFDLPSNVRENIFLKMENSIKTRINLIKTSGKVSKETKDILIEVMDYFLHQTQLRKIWL